MDTILPYIQHPDFSFWAAFFVVSGLFVYLGSQKMYSVLVGGVFGFLSFVLLSTSFDVLLGFFTESPAKQFAITNKMLIQSVAFYGIFVAAVLVPLNKNLSISTTFSDGAPALIERMIVWAWAALFFLGVLFGAAEKASFFRVQWQDGFFAFLKNWEWWIKNSASSEIYHFCIQNLNTILLSSILGIFYKIFLSQVITTIFIWIQKMLQKMGAKIAEMTASKGGGEKKK